MPDDDAAAKLQKAHGMVQAYQEFIATVAVLTKDVEHCAEMANSTQEQFWRRSLVRAFFADVEGTIYRMKQIAYACREQTGVSFSTGEEHVMLEKAYSLDDKGLVQEQRMQITLLNNMRFSFSIYARAHTSDYKLNVSDNRWNDFRASVKIRDRLMHPKRAADLDVSVDEMSTLQNAYDWYMQNRTAVMESSVGAMTEGAMKGMTVAEAQEFARCLELLEAAEVGNP